MGTQRRGTGICPCPKSTGLSMLFSVTSGTMGQKGWFPLLLLKRTLAYLSPFPDVQGAASELRTRTLCHIQLYFSSAYYLTQNYFKNEQVNEYIHS